MTQRQHEIGPMGGGLEHGSEVASTPERILLAAERLFAERGFDAVSLREITAAAQVNSAAAHYHFGSKEAVLRGLFEQRARPIVERREELFRRLESADSVRPSLEDVLVAFLQPALEVLDTPQGKSFSMLRARMAFEREDVRRDILGLVFDRSSELALAALSRALPGLPRETLYWRFHFLLGSMVYTMATPRRIESIVGEHINTGDAEAALSRLVVFAAAGFRAP